MPASGQATWIDSMLMPGQLRVLVAAEQREPPAEADEDQRHQQHRDVDDRCRPIACPCAVFGVGQHVDIEVRAVAHRDHRASMMSQMKQKRATSSVQM